MLAILRRVRIRSSIESVISRAARLDPCVAFHEQLVAMIEVLLS